MTFYHFFDFFLRMFGRAGGSAIHRARLSVLCFGSFLSFCEDLDFSEVTFHTLPHLKCTKWLFTHLPHVRCIRLGSVRSSHLPFKMHYVRSSLHVSAPTSEKPKYIRLVSVRLSHLPLKTH